MMHYPDTLWKYLRICNRLLFLCILTLFAVKTSAKTIFVSGNVSGTWNADTVIVTSDIHLPWGQSLVIQPGCVVLFEKAYGFDVSGTLNAIGLRDNKILFSAMDTTGFSTSVVGGGWKGIRIGSSAFAKTVMEWCIFQYMKGDRLVNCENGAALINNCQFFNNKGSWLVNLGTARTDFVNCIFSKNTATHIVVMTNSWTKDTTRFRNNTIVNNSANAIWVTPSYHFSAFELTNNILWGNLGSIKFNAYDDGYGNATKLILNNCIIEDGSRYPWFNSTCYTSYPKFKDTAALDFSLLWENYPVQDESKSIAIDNGHFLMPFDADGSRSDIGAIPFIHMGRLQNSTVQFSADTLIGYRSRLTVHFKNTSFEGDQPSWFWDFGDGTTSHEKNPTHTYEQSGQFTVSLKAVDRTGSQNVYSATNLIEVFPGTKVEPGTVMGLWEKRYSPYYVHGKITVPQQERLQIEPGTKILFMGPYEMIVRGSLIAQGTATDSIEFRAFDTTTLTINFETMKQLSLSTLQVQYRRGGWAGLHINKDKRDQDSVVLAYCKISHVRPGNPNMSREMHGALTIKKATHAWVQNCSFKNNIIIRTWEYGGDSTSGSSAGVAFVQCNARVYDSHFENTYQEYGGAIGTHFVDSAFIKGNTIENVTNPTVFWHTNHLIIESNVFRNNRGNQVLMWNGFDYYNKRKAYSQISQNLFFANDGINIAIGQQDKIKILQNKFIENFSTYEATCLNLSGDSIYVLSNLFDGNRTSGNLGNLGAVCMTLQLNGTKAGYFANNTMVNNRGNFYQSAGIYADEDTKVYNNIFRNQTAPELRAFRWTTSYESSTFKQVANNNIKGGYDAGVNFDMPAGFVDSLNHNFQLTLSSPGIDRGFGETFFLTERDLANQARIDPIALKVDIGAYELVKENQPPSNILLSNNELKEKFPVGSFIGKFSTEDPNLYDAHSYKLVNTTGGNANQHFTISTDSLYSNTVFTFGQENIYPINVEVKDRMGATFEKAFVIAILQNIVTSIIEVGVLPQGIVLTPNPFHDFMTLQNRTNETVSLFMYDASGKLVFYQKYKPGRELVRPNVSASGIYYLMLEVKKRHYSLKVIKM